MSDDEEQTGKRRKSLEVSPGGAVTEVAVPSQSQERQFPARRRESFEALCSPSYIAKESSRPSSRRPSVEMMRPEAKNRMSLELSRDVEQINQELSQLLFSDPKGGSLDSRRSRGPQSYRSNLRATTGETSGDIKMPWQTAAGNEIRDSSTASGSGAQTLPWMTAPPSDPCGPLRPQRSSLSESRSRRVQLVGRRSSLTTSPSEQMAAASNSSGPGGSSLPWDSNSPGAGGPAMPWDLDSGEAGDAAKPNNFQSRTERRRRSVNNSHSSHSHETSTMDTSQ